MENYLLTVGLILVGLLFFARLFTAVWKGDRLTAVLVVCFIVAAFVVRIGG